MNEFVKTKGSVIYCKEASAFHLCEEPGNNNQTISEQGLMVIPHELKTTDDGDALISAKDSSDDNWGPDQAQDFAKLGSR